MLTATFRLHVQIQEMLRDSLDLEKAIEASFQDNPRITQDLDGEEFLLIGSLCQIYWVDDSEWYYGRILNINHDTKQYYVWYIEDQKSEWVDFNREPIVISEDVILVASRKNKPWPAQKYLINDMALGILSSRPGYLEKCNMIFNLSFCVLIIYC